MENCQSSLQNVNGRTGITEEVLAKWQKENVENLAKRCNDAGDGGEARWRTGRHAAAQLGTEDDLRAGAGQVSMEHIVVVIWSHFDGHDADAWS